MSGPLCGILPERISGLSIPKFNCTKKCQKLKPALVGLEVEMPVPVTVQRLLVIEALVAHITSNNNINMLVNGTRTLLKDNP